MFQHVLASRLRNVCLNFAFFKILVEKMTFPVIFDTDHSFKRQNALSLTKKLFINVSKVRCSSFVILYFKEKFCVSERVGKSLAWCLLSKPSVPKTLSKK